MLGKFGLIWMLREPYFLKQRYQRNKPLRYHRSCRLLVTHGFLQLNCLPGKRCFLQDILDCRQDTLNYHLDKQNYHPDIQSCHQDKQNYHQDIQSCHQDKHYYRQDTLNYHLDKQNYHQGTLDPHLCNVQAQMYKADRYRL